MSDSTLSRTFWAMSKNGFHLRNISADDFKFWEHGNSFLYEINEAAKICLSVNTYFADISFICLYLPRYCLLWTLFHSENIKVKMV